MTRTARWNGAPPLWSLPSTLPTSPPKTCGRPSLKRSSAPTCPNAISARRRSFMSIRPAVLWWAAPWATPVSRDERSSWTPTAALRLTAAAVSPERTPPRWTAQLPIWPGMRLRTWWPPALPTGARSSWLTPSAWQSRSLFWWTPMAQALWPMTVWQRSSSRSLTSAPPASSGHWTCAGRSTGRQRPTATSDGRIWISPGSGWIRRRR